MLVPEDASQSSFAGFLRVGGEEFRVRVLGVRYDGTRALLGAAELEAEPPLAALLQPHADSLKARLAQSTSLDDFLRELEELVGISGRPSASPAAVSGRNELQLAAATDLPTTEHYTRLLDELDAVGWHHVMQLSEDLCSLFELFLGRFQGFWDVLDDVDDNTCVLEPHHPTRATGRRRIALEKHVSIQMVVSPASPMSICELTFFGSEAAVAPLRERWSSSLFQWDETLTPRKNLERALGVSFPSPSDRKMEEFATECGICYSYRLELDADPVAESNSKRLSAASDPQRTMIPDRLCENRNCNRPFHDKCLFDWLKALPTARQSFSTVFGECPYCRETISAKLMI